MDNTIKMRSGDYFLPVDVEYKNDRLYFSFRYHPAYFPLMDEIKAMEKRTWHQDEKKWSIPLTERNQITLKYLIQGQENPFEIYSAPIINHKSSLNLWPHQQNMMDFMLTRRKCIIAADTGTGKTLSLLATIIETGADPKDVFYVTTTASIQAFMEEIRKWGIEFMPQLMTFERLVRLTKEWTLDDKLPYVLIADESHKLKTDGTARSDAFRNMADAVRKVYKDSYILLASGTPAPNTPIDYWNQCEIACPGFLKESSPKLLTKTLAFQELTETPHGMAYKVKGWRDDAKKCGVCGEYKEKCNRADCTYKPSINEVERLYNRLKGLVLVVDKKEVLSWLPDKNYRVYDCTPTEEMLSLAETIEGISENAMESLVKLRALSDGFQYFDTVDGEKVCAACEGKGFGVNFEVLENEEDWFGIINEAVETKGKCFICDGTGKVPNIKRAVETIDSPKLKALGELLEEYDRRVIIYASFHASIDRIKEFCLSKRWAVFSVDGRGWKGVTPSGDVIAKDDMIKYFQGNELEKIAWVGHPQTSGTGLTLTASPVAIFYSNSFKADDRFQAEDRIHRPGMDLNKGATIIDLCCLETDNVIREAILKKEKLQNITLGKIREAINVQRRKTS